MLSLLVRTTETITGVVVLDRFRPMLLPRHLVDIYGACFTIEYCCCEERGSCDDNSNALVGWKHYRMLGLSLPKSSSMLASRKEHSASTATIVDPTLRAMAYQALLSSSSQPQKSINGNKPPQQKQQQQNRLYRPWLQNRVSGLLTDLATNDLRGLSAILTVFVPVVSSSVDQASLMTGASQRLGRTLAAMTEARDEHSQHAQGRLCHQLLILLGMAIPMMGGEAAKSNNAGIGIPPRSMAVIQTAWAFFEHLPTVIIDTRVLGYWANCLLSKEESTTTGIHGTIRQVGALCAFVPPHSALAVEILRKAALFQNKSFRDCTLLGQFLRVSMLPPKLDGSSWEASWDAHQTLLSLTQAIYVGNSGDYSASAAATSNEEEEESARDKIVAAWILALGPTQWDLAGHSYACKRLSDANKNKSPMEMLTVQTHRPLLTPTPMEEFIASVESTTARATFFVEKILLVLAPANKTPTSNEESVPRILQGLPSRFFRFLLRQYLSGEKRGIDNNGNSRLVATVLLPILCEKCSQEQLLFGNHQDNASGLLLLIRQVLSELEGARDASREDGDHDNGERHEFLKSIAGILTSLLIALMEVGSKSRSKVEEDILQSFLPILRSLSISTTDTYHSDDRKDDAAMADMAAYAMALIASRSSSAMDEKKQTGEEKKYNFSAEDRLRAILEESEKDLGSTQAPIRARGIVSLGRLARGFTGALAKEQKTPSLVQELDDSGQELGSVDETIEDWVEKVLELSMMALSDKESYVFLAAIQTIVAVGDLHPQRVLPNIAFAIANGRLACRTDSSRTVSIPLSQEQIIKLADALIFIIRRRAVTDEYVPMLVNLILRGGTQKKDMADTTINAQDLIQKDRIPRIQQETDNYFASTGRTSSEENSDDDDDSIALTQKELWEEQDIRLKTGGPVFDFEEAEVVRSLRISIVSELVASAAPHVLAPYIGLLSKVAREALLLEQDSRMVQRSAALLARELYARAQREALDLADALGGIANRAVVVPISTALVESDEEALLATLTGFASSANTARPVLFDSAVLARCREALELRNQADKAGVFVASKLVLEERRRLEEMPALLRSITTSAASQNGGESKTNPVSLTPIETLR